MVVFFVVGGRYKTNCGDLVVCMENYNKHHFRFGYTENKKTFIADSLGDVGNGLCVVPHAHHVKKWITLKNA